MLNSILILLTSVMLMGCVVTPDGWGVAPGVGVDTSIDVGLTPRIHVSSRTGLSVWLHPNFVVADAYTIAQEHCSRYGTYARPARNWNIHTNSARYLDYTCVTYRPVLAFPHIIADHSRYYTRPWHKRWYHRRHGRYYRPGSVYTPKPRNRYNSPKKNGWWGVNKPSKDKYRSRPTYTPKPNSPKKNGWWGGINKPSKDRYRNNNSGYGNRGSVYTPKPKKSYSPKKWSRRPVKKVVKKDKWFSKKKVITKKAPYGRKVVKTKEVVSVKKSITKPKKKSFSKNKVNTFEKKKVSKKKSFML